ncbi:RNA-protein complex protein Nop10 [Methanothermobacter wolfeii]|uniref:RNA-protein complex protein Nop10 n=1 Tax=Methanothermobacter wolfeii TaxID=145261 RepID=UPI0024B33B5B|nr:RNA-protein complex protein Nop10 [Methanothermobacter wolfeii]MDI6702582.1 RNA-protein complex protein Nop10 [Methanothermobacter wolfeii]MDI6841799.1 RNA-protein complex protein Nop10 [Methanothermobacter wolfeii]
MKMKRCRSCGEYTLRDVCPHCGGATGVVYPPKFSPEDRYGKYRRKLKRELLMKNNGE